MLYDHQMFAKCYYYSYFHPKSCFFLATHQFTKQNRVLWQFLIKYLLYQWICQNFHVSIAWTDLNFFEVSVHLLSLRVTQLFLETRHLHTLLLDPNSIIAKSDHFDFQKMFQSSSHWSHPQPLVHPHLDFHHPCHQFLSNPISLFSARYHLP